MESGEDGGCEVEQERDKTKAEIHYIIGSALIYISNIGLHPIIEGLDRN